MESHYKPILRYVDVIPAKHEDKPVFLLRDPIGIIEELVVVPQNVFFLLPLMDGKHDLRDLQVEATKRLGEIVPLEEIIKIVEFLDEKGLLWSKNFEEIKNKAYEKWLSLPFRPMAYANHAYPQSPAEVKFFLEDILKLTEVESKEPPRILIAPHIDLKIGAKAFAESYSRFKIPSGSRVIILGIGHHLDLPWSVLSKNLATPFGLVKNDRGGLLYLSNSKKIELFPDHITHKLEHSIEFQVLFLHYLLKDEFVVLPFLIGPLITLLDEKNKDLVEKLIEGLVELIDEKTYIVLGIDFCHLGPRYGDPFIVSQAQINKVIETDKTIVHLTFNGSSEEFLNKAKETLPLKICGISALYLLNLILNKAKIKGNYEIFYQSALPFGQGSIVSVTSGGFYF